VRREDLSEGGPVGMEKVVHVCTDGALNGWVMYKFNCTRQLHESIVIEWMCKCECRTHRESVLLKINLKCLN
jgi:hypothetical protein